MQDAFANRQAVTKLPQEIGLAVARPEYEAHLDTKGLQDHSCHTEAQWDPPQVQ